MGCSLFLDTHNGNCNKNEINLDTQIVAINMNSIYYLYAKSKLERERSYSFACIDRERQGGYYAGMNHAAFL